MLTMCNTTPLHEFLKCFSLGMKIQCTMLINNELRLINLKINVYIYNLATLLTLKIKGKISAIRVHLTL